MILLRRPALAPRLRRQLATGPASGGGAAPDTGPRVWFDVSVALSLRAGDGGTGDVADGGTVGRLDDQSGHGWHAAQATAGKRPVLLVAGGAGGDKRELVFDGADDFLATTEITTDEDATYFLSGRAAGAGGLFAHHASGVGSDYLGDYLFRPGEAMGYRGQYVNGATSNIAFSPNGSTYYVWCLQITPGGAKTRTLYVNGVFSGDTGDAIGSAPLVGPVVLGALSPSSYPGGLRLHEFRKYDRALTLPEIETVSAAQMAKWGIT